MHPTDTDADDPQLPGKDRNFVTALARGLELLRAFGAGEEYLGNAELSNRTSIPRPTVSRLTYTLTQLGYLQHNTHLEKYRLGPGVLALGYRFLANMGIREIARPHLQKFADATDCNVSLGGADRSDMVYLETCHGHGPLIIRLDTAPACPLPLPPLVVPGYAVCLTNGASRCSKSWPASMVATGRVMKRVYNRVSKTMHSTVFVSLSRIGSAILARWRCR